MDTIDKKIPQAPPPLDIIFPYGKISKKYLNYKNIFTPLEI